MSLELLGLPRKSLPYRSWPDRGIPGITGLVITAIGYVRACFEFLVPSASMAMVVPSADCELAIPTITVTQKIECP